MVIWPALLLVSGLVILSPALAERTTTSSNNNGIFCGSKQCLKDVTECTLTDRCRCPAGTYGPGDFRCYPNVHERTQMYGKNNKMTTLANASANVHWPCRARYTEVVTTRPSDGTKCHVQVFALNKVISHRVVVAGVEVHVKVGDEDGIAIRKTGIHDHGVFTFTEWGKDTFQLEEAITDLGQSFSPETLNVESDGSGSGDSPMFSFSTAFGIDEEEDDWGPPQVLEVGEGKVVRALPVDGDNFAVIDLSECGMDVRFRPPSDPTESSGQTSGLAVSVDSTFNPEYPSPSAYLAESPATNPSRFGDDTDMNEAIALDAAMVYGAKQATHTRAGKQCDQAAHTYRTACTTRSDRMMALASCSPFLTNSTIISCMEPSTDGSGYESIKAFKLCLTNACMTSHSVCNLFKLHVEKRDCVGLVPGLEDMTC